VRFYWLILGILGVWRTTHLLHAEDGPWDLLARLRRSLGNGFLGQLLDCFYCSSLWIAVPFAWAIGQSWRERILLWPALSGASALLQRATTPGGAGPLDSAAPVMYTEDKEPGNVLRQDPDSGLSEKGVLPPS
jgi:hypothetical protein